MATMWRATPQKITSMQGTLRQTVKGAPAVSLDDALFHLRIDSGIEDAYVESLIMSVQQELEPPNGWLGRALTTSQYQLRLPCFAREIVLPGAPVQSIESITYLDDDGVESTVDANVYRLTEDEPASVILNEGSEWPTGLTTRPDAVRINFTAGFGDDDLSVPEVIRQYMLIMIAHRYESRQAAVVGTIVQPTPYVHNMLEGWRIR